MRPGWDEEKGPSVVLADGTQTIFTADMSGDGLTDIVRVRNGEACYWPNTGYGRFGAKVTMDRAPRFDNEERFDPAPHPARGHRRVRHRRPPLHRRGRRDGLVQPVGQRVGARRPSSRCSRRRTRLSSVQVLDLLGTGTACLVWSSPLPGQAAAPLRYVDLMGGRSRTC